jgi:hypothetical protein
MFLAKAASEASEGFMRAGYPSAVGRSTWLSQIALAVGRCEFGTTKERPDGLKDIMAGLDAVIHVFCTPKLRQAIGEEEKASKPFCA